MCVWQVYYNYDCDNEIGDVYVRSHIQSNLKNQLSKEKKRADERVKITRSLGYTRATRRMLKPHYFGKGAWESITKHWESEKFEKASKKGKENRKKLDLNHRSGATPFSVRRAIYLPFYLNFCLLFCLESNLLYCVRANICI